VKPCAVKDRHDVSVNYVGALNLTHSVSPCGVDDVSLYCKFPSKGGNVARLMFLCAGMSDAMLSVWTVCGNITRIFHHSW